MMRPSVQDVEYAVLLLLLLLLAGLVVAFESNDNQRPAPTTVEVVR